MTSRTRIDGYAVAGIDLRPSRCALSLVGDVSDAGAVSAAVAEIVEALGPPAVAVTAAGVYEEVAVTDIDAARWTAMLRLHLGGTVNTCRASTPHMLRAGGGHIVCVASELALCGADLSSHYAAAKGAIIGLTRALALELATTGVRVNAVAPGPTDTSMLPEDSPWRSAEYLETVPLRRLVTPEEVAHTVAFLVAEGSFYTGQVLSPNGGVVI